MGLIVYRSKKPSGAIRWVYFSIPPAFMVEIANGGEPATERL
jgi:fructose-1,6-bisphosphatase